MFLPTLCASVSPHLCHAARGPEPFPGFLPDLTLADTTIPQLGSRATWAGTVPTASGKRSFSVKSPGIIYVSNTASSVFQGLPIAGKRIPGEAGERTGKPLSGGGWTPKELAGLGRGWASARDRRTPQPDTPGPPENSHRATSCWPPVSAGTEQVPTSPCAPGRGKDGQMRVEQCLPPGEPAV